MNCADFERWLDGGRPEHERAAAEAHGQECHDCAGALAAAVEVAALLATPGFEAPSALTDDIMHRVAAEPQRRTDLATNLSEPTFPWWIQCLAQPETVLAAALGAITLGVAPKLAALGASLFTSGSSLAATLTPPALQFSGEPSLTTMLVVGALLCGSIALAGWGLYRWSNTIFTTPLFARRGR